MKNYISWTKYLALVLGIFAISSDSRAQSCLTKCSDYLVCQGFTRSAFCRNCLLCGDPPPCYCAAASQSVSYLDTVHPGIFLSQQNGHVIVSKVLKGSPAFPAGVRPGDEVVGINGKNLAVLDCEDQKWASSSDPLVSFLTVRRDGAQKIVPLRLVPLRLLAENAWHWGSLKLASSRDSGTPELLPADRALGTFTVGIRAARHNLRIIVAAVLEGSSAYRAGLQPGDEIVMVDQDRASNLTDYEIAAMLSHNSDTTLVLTLRRDETEWNVTLPAEGLAQVLSRVDARVHPSIHNRELARAE